MNLRVIVEDNETNKRLDISELVQELTWTTHLQGVAGQVSFTMIPSDFNFNPGSKVWVSIPNKANIFAGRIFTAALTKTKCLNLTCYDQTRYLKNRDTYIFKNMAVHQIFEKICKDYELDYEIAARVNYICAPRTQDGIALMDMIQMALDETFIKTGEYLFVRDDFGTLKLENLMNFHRDYLLDNDILNLDFSYHRSIDEESYSRVKLVGKEIDKQSGKEKTIISFQQNSNLVNKWGVLLYRENISKSTNQAELDNRAQELLKLKGRTTKKLSFTTDGKLDVFAGCGLYINLESITNDPINKWCEILSAKHTFKNQEHTMNLEVLL